MPCQKGSQSHRRAAVLTPGAGHALPCHGRGKHMSHCISKAASGSLSSQAEPCYYVSTTPVWPHRGIQPMQMVKPLGLGGGGRWGVFCCPERLLCPPLATHLPPHSPAQEGDIPPATFSQAKLSRALGAAGMIMLFLVSRKRCNPQSQSENFLWREGRVKLLAFRQPYSSFASLHLPKHHLLQLSDGTDLPKQSLWRLYPCK